MVESIRVDVYHHFGDGDAKLDRLIASVDALTVQIKQQETKIMATFQDLIAAVENETTVEQGVVVLLQRLSTELTTAIAVGATPASLQAIVDQINANANLLAGAVVANTPTYP